MTYQNEIFRLSEEEHRCEVMGEEVYLTPKQWNILVILLKRPGVVFSREQLLSLVWPNVYVVSRNCDYNIMILRRKLGKVGDWIETVTSFGYRLSPKPSLDIFGGGSE